MAAPPKKAAGLSLYADLLEPDKSKSGSATISGAPVRYDIKDNTAAGEDGAVKKKDASLKFQPIKRPQVPQKTKPKTGGASSSSAHKFSSSTVSASVSASSPEKQQQAHPNSTSGLQPQQPSVQQSNFEDWVGDEDDYYFQDNKPKHERGGRKKKKKNKPQERQWDWDDIYDPTLPNNYADYKGSEEQAREIRDWKARLYYRQLKEAKKARRDGSMGSDDDEVRSKPMNSMFAPPSNLSFAPPSFDEGARDSRMNDEDEDDYYPPDTFSSNDREHKSYDGPPAFARALVPDDATGEDVYMRRMRMSGMAAAEPPPASTSPPPPAGDAEPTPPPVARAPDPDIDSKRADAAAKIAAFKAKLAGQAPKPPTAEPVQPTPETQQPAPPAPPPEPEREPSATISRAPVRYDVPPTSANDTPMISNDAPMPPPEQTRSSRPGQKGFAERLLKRYGWSKGQGLGAEGTGITTAIVAQASKRKKRSDAEGGGWAAPANMGKIVGGKKRKLDPSSTQEEEGDVTSEVVKFEGMLEGLDVGKEIEEGGLMQEIGDEMAREYGNVERVFIWREEMGGGNEVFVKFTSPASAVRAVQGMQGAEFAGNEVRAGFWDGGKFEAGEYA